MTPTLQIEHNLAEVNRVFDTYWRVRNRGIDAALQKTGSEFSKFFYQRLKPIAAKAGATRQSNLAAMKRGRGLKIHKQAMPNVFGGGSMSQDELIASRLNRNFNQKVKKNRLQSERANRIYAHGQKLAASMFGGAKPGAAHRLGMQALRVDNELNLRESHRMFLASSALYGFNRGKDVFSMSKDKRVRLGRATIRSDVEKGSLDFSWGKMVSGQSELAAKGLLLHGPQTALAMALVDTAANMKKYLENNPDKVFAWNNRNA